MVSGGPLLEPGEQAAAQSRLGLVLAATARMAGSLDLRAVAQALAETVVPKFADCAVVELVEDILRPGGAGLHASPMLQVALAGTPAEGVAADVHLVPLVARGRVLGRASFTRAAGSPPYGDADRALADELAARAALALDNVRLYDEARATAVELQRSLLPANRPRITGVEMAHRYLPGSHETEVGGDWFDVLPLSCGRVAFVIGDVMGRGLRAAAAMGQLRTAVRTLAVLDLMPDELLAQLDHLAMGIAQVQLATCVYAVFDPVTRELCFATAGHPPPLLRDPDGTAQFLPSPSGAPLGVGGVPFEAAPASVQDGARLLLYTDGLIESRGADLDDGLAALAAAFVAAPAGLDPLCDHVLERPGPGRRARRRRRDAGRRAARARAVAHRRVESARRRDRDSGRPGSRADGAAELGPAAHGGDRRAARHRARHQRASLRQVADRAAGAAARRHRHVLGRRRRPATATVPPVVVRRRRWPWPAARRDAGEPVGRTGDVHREGRVVRAATHERWCHALTVGKAPALA